MDPIKGAQFLEPRRQERERAIPGGAAQPSDRVELGAAEKLELLPRGAARAEKSSAISQAGESRKFPRPMTNVEKSRFMRDFPALDTDRAVVTAPATDEYNCISWTVGETRQWFWPPEMFPDLKEEAAFDKFYASYGLAPATKGEVARWRNAEGLTHGCVSGHEHGPRWESKCGSDLRLQHDLGELEGELYGKVDGYYTRKGGVRSMAAYEPAEIPAEVLAGVAKKAARVEPEVREKFEALYHEWQKYREEPKVRFSANPAVHCRTESFDGIAMMGLKALPLLMEKMAQGDFFCLKAVETIRRQAPPYESVMVPHLSVEEHNNSEQNKAALLLTRWNAD